MGSDEDMAVGFQPVLSSNGQRTAEPSGAWAHQSADAFLASRTDEQLAAALRRGEEELGVIDFLEATETFEGDGPERLSKAYEVWSGRDYSNRRRMISMAMEDTRREQSRRASVTS